MQIMDIGHVTDPASQLEKALFRVGRHATLGFTDDAGSSYITLQCQVRVGGGGRGGARRVLGNAKSLWKLIQPPNGLTALTIVGGDWTGHLEIVIEYLGRHLPDYTRVVAITD